MGAGKGLFVLMWIIFFFIVYIVMEIAMFNDGIGESVMGFGMTFSPIPRTIINLLEGILILFPFQFVILGLGRMIIGEILILLVLAFVTVFFQITIPPVPISPF
ncbi:MAG TPA: hypothetical protein VFD03_10835 [Clostridia bacterium]|nr:hypothetical protein [Clostridia bacterium]